MGNLKLAGIPPGPTLGEDMGEGAPGVVTPPFAPVGICKAFCPSEEAEGVREFCRRPRWNAFILADNSDDMARPLGLEESDGVGRRAALTGPRGLEDAVIPAMADVDTERGFRGGGSRGASGPDGAAIFEASEGCGEGGDSVTRGIEASVGFESEFIPLNLL